jgi:Ca2+-binding RTX toxin-like protein
LSTASSGAITVSYATSAGSASAGRDYTETSGTLSFAPGETSKTFSIPIIGDTAFEGNESFFVNLTGATGAILGTNGTSGAIAEIVNDDPAPLPVASLSPTFPTITEGHSGVKAMEMSVWLSAPSKGLVVVVYATSGGSDSYGPDFIPSSGSVVFLPGETVKAFFVPILGDSAFEGGDSFFINLTSAVGAVLGTNGTSGAIAEILNDDTPPSPGQVFIGGIGADVVRGQGTDDTLDGGAGSDQLYGGPGNDLYYADTSSDLIFESAGEGTDTVSSSAGFYLYANLENLTLTGNAQFGVGNEWGNVLRGNAMENLLIAGAGGDLVYGGGARDAIFGEAGADVLYGDAGVDYIVAGLGNDTLYGGADADEIYGQEGDDLIYGGDDFATDILVGGDGNDTIDGGLAWDQMYGGPGNDTFYVSQQVDWVFEQPGEGTDTVIADSPNGYYLFANVENLTLVGNTPFGVGNELGNLIIGNAIGNTLLAGAGNDTLDGGAGLDILWGQAGADTFRVGKGTGTDIIADFQVGTDKLDVSAFGFTSLAQLKARMVQVSNDVALDLGNGDQVILLGVAASAIGPADVVLGGGG